jgi:hypothetical protein
MKEREVTLAGFKFTEVRQGDIWLKKEPCPDPERLVLLAMDMSRDDYLDFPADSQIETAHLLGGALAMATDGFTAHRFWETALIGEESLGFKGHKDRASARQIDVLGDSFHGEWQYVMTAHGWMEGLTLPRQSICDQLVKLEGPELITKAKERFGENYEAFLCEVAAAHFATPLSRLWYAANMYSLYYAHHDDLRLGYLWAEYRLKMRQNENVQRGSKTVRAASAGGNSRQAEYEAHRRSVVTAMATHIHNGLSIKRSAELAYKSGVGTSAEANRRLFARANSSDQ